MDIDEDTDWRLGCPTPLEMCQQHVALLENEYLEQGLRLRKARENIYGLVKMNDELVAENKQLRGYLTEKGAQAAELRQQIGQLTASAAANKREAEMFREILEGLTPRPNNLD